MRIRLLAFLVLVVLATTVPSAGAAVGDLDTSYSGDGITKASFYTRGDSVLVDAQGRILVGGTHATNGRPALLRYKANGALDPTFSGDGKATLPTIGGVVDLARQGTKILVLVDNTVFRITSGGALDKTYGGGDGQVQVGGSGLAIASHASLVYVLEVPEQEGVQYVARLNGERITRIGLDLLDEAGVVSGEQHSDLVVSLEGAWLYTSGWGNDGEPDSLDAATVSRTPASGTTGRWTVYAERSDETRANAIAVDPTSGDVVVGGWEDGGDFTDGTLVLAMRVSQAGGVVWTSAAYCGDFNNASDIAVSPAGRVLLAGYGYNCFDCASEPPYSPRFAVWRFGSGGQPNFCRMTEGAGTSAGAVAASGEKIVAAGERYTVRYLG